MLLMAKLEGGAIELLTLFYYDYRSIFTTDYLPGAILSFDDNFIIFDTLLGGNWPISANRFTKLSLTAANIIFSSISLS